ncbi:flagellar assembly factor FliW [Salirhabdus euzebyi]|uniref:Flagellar assembly factor FliW n=1 Tax=Salirhabdus euzebyi TaxID=394506 RepID=A0A841Q5E2_9BACI|nr:flagellar assembly protein FliW [Salirhabdus euzebyi]MBB6453626.1 flagellar assembly factor FliW [Salirhabdus euzebyi]
MKINTLYFGEVEVKEEELLTFEKGIPGFNKEKNFVLLDIPENPTFQVMQSIETEELAFVVTNPYLFYNNYEFDLDQTTIELLEVEKPEDVLVKTIVTMQSPFESSTLNLQAPVVCNIKNKKAKQLVLNNSPYMTRHPLSVESEAKVHASANKKNR